MSLNRLLHFGSTCRGLGAPFLGALALSTVVVASLAARLGLVDALEAGAQSPVEMRLRDWVGLELPIDPRLRVFVFDDRAYATLGHAQLTGREWADLLGALAAAHPAAIITPAIFGGSELQDAVGPLPRAIAAARAAGVRMIGAVEPVPARSGGRETLDPRRMPLRPTSWPASAALADWDWGGPIQAVVDGFSQVGHIYLDNGGRIYPALRTRGGQVIPHVALGLSDVEIPATDGVFFSAVDVGGRARLDFPPVERLLNRTFTLNGFFKGRRTFKAVKPNDVVLVIANFLTGYSSYFQSPLGSLPAGLLSAVEVNASLQNGWVAAPTWPVTILVLSLMVAASVPFGATLSALSLFLASLSVAVGTAVLGVACFAVTEVSWPWMASVVMFGCGSLATGLRGSQLRLRRDRQAEALVEREKARLSAVAHTTQMLAHDVRKPFSLLNLTVQSLQGETEPHKAVDLLRRILPELYRSMAAVDGLLRDVMDIDRDDTPTVAQVGVEKLLLDCLQQVFLGFPSAHVALRFELHHSLPLAIDYGKIQRALTNILENAVQAMNGAGEIWLRTADAPSPAGAWTELRIGNTGSFIPPESLPRIFDSFFTQGKARGTGLGLAIAKKMVTAHGGSIDCRSDRAGGTEFRMTLPAAHATPYAEVFGGPLPKTSNELVARWQATALFQNSKPQDAAREQQLKRHVEAQVARLGRPLRLLIVDDEEAFVDSTRALMQSLLGRELLEVTAATNGQDALAIAASRRPELIVCDIDLGPLSPSGVETVAELRRLGIMSKVVMHSNRLAESAAAEAAAAGANGYLRKPARRVQLIEMLAGDPDVGDAAPPPVRLDEREGAARPRIAVVDDNEFVLDAWETMVSDADIVRFASPRVFLEQIASPEFLAGLTYLVLDFYFDANETLDGLQVAQAVLAKRRLPVFLSTDAALGPLPAGITAIPKVAHSAATLEALATSAAVPKAG